MPHVPGVGLNDKLRVAASKGNTDKVLELINAGATCDADRDGRTALHFASHYGHSDTVAALLLAGCDVNAPDFSGHTALQRAAAEGHADVVLQLLRHGAQIDHQDDVHGNTSLHEASWKGYSRTLEALCKAQANAYIKNKYGDTPLHTAARYGHAGVMRILISARCDVNEQNKNGDTGLHISSAMGRRKLTRLLLEASCDKNILNKQGETAMDIARRKCFAEVGNLLANPPPPKTVDGERAQALQKQRKKREKESGTSKDSRDSGSRRKEKHKKSKSGRSKSQQPTDRCPKGHVSPYGCHTIPSLQPFQSPKLDTLPSEPLKRGEQYFLDLGGNIKKGPVGVAYACYCVPFFRNVEKKMESDKLELMEHIDLAHDNLNAKISNLERRTRSQMLSISESVKERIAAEKTECLDRVVRVTQQEFARQQNGACFQCDPAGVGTNSNGGAPGTRSRGRGASSSPSPVPLLLREDDTSSTSEEEDDEENIDGNGKVQDVNATQWRQQQPSGHVRPQRGHPRTSPAVLAAEVAAAARASIEVQFNRSKSEEVLSRRRRSSSPKDSQEKAVGCQVYPAVLGIVGYTLEGPAPRDDDKLLLPARRVPDGGDPRASRAIGSSLEHKQCSRSDAADVAPPPPMYYVEGDRGLSEYHWKNDSVVLNRDAQADRPPSGPVRDQDQDSGYKTKLHSSFESQASGFHQPVPAADVPGTTDVRRVPPRPPRGCAPPNAGVEPLLAGHAMAFDFDDDQQFFHKVSHETEKWYERRRQSQEKTGALLMSPLLSASVRGKPCNAGVGLMMIGASNLRLVPQQQCADGSVNHSVEGAVDQRQIVSPHQLAHASAYQGMVAGRRNASSLV